MYLEDQKKLLALFTWPGALRTKPKITKHDEARLQCFYAHYHIEQGASPPLKKSSAAYSPRSRRWEKGQNAILIVTLRLESEKLLGFFTWPEALGTKPKAHKTYHKTSW